MNTVLMYVIGALMLACGVFAFLWQRAKRQLAEAIAAGEKHARKIEHEAYEGMSNDIKKENEVTGSIDDGDFLN